MRTWMKGVLACLFVFQAVGVFAEEKISCDALAELSDTLSELTDLVTDEADKIEEGSEADVALGKLVKALRQVAKAEDSDRLDLALKALNIAWKDDNGEWAQFPAALAIVTYEFDQIYYNEGCEKNSEEEYTEKELGDLAYTLRQLDMAIEAGVRIKDDSPLDLAFENLLTDLGDLVDATDDADLKKKVKQLRAAWEESDWAAFAKQCDAVADAIEEL